MSTLEDSVREGQVRRATWLGVDISQATSVAQADFMIYMAAPPESYLEEARILGIYEEIQGLPYGAAAGPVQRARLKWSKTELQREVTPGTKVWHVGTLLRWEPPAAASEPDLEDEADTPAAVSTPNLWVVSAILLPKGKVTIKPFAPAVVLVTPHGAKDIITLSFPTLGKAFRHLSVFNLRDAKIVPPEDLILS